MFGKLPIVICCAALIAGLTPAAVLADSDNTDLQAQITEMREKLQKVEAQLKETSDKQRTAATGEKIKVSGYIQARLSGEKGDVSTFNVSRARLKLAGHVSERSEFTFQIDARTKDGKVDLRDAYVDRWLTSQKGKFARAGQFKTPIMYEVLESSSERLAPERTAIARAMFPGERDVGVLLHFESAKRPAFDLGLVNGQGRNSNDKNTYKDVLARVLVPVGKGSAYVGFYNGQFVNATGATTSKTRYAIGTEQAFGKASFRAEYVSGANLGKDVNGWYAQAAVPLKRDTSILFVRYDVFDSDLDAPDSTFNRTTFGIEHRLDAKSRLTLAFEVRDADAGFVNQNTAVEGNPDGNALALQYQVKY